MTGSFAILLLSAAGTAVVPARPGSKAAPVSTAKAAGSAASPAEVVSPAGPPGPADVSQLLTLLPRHADRSLCPTFEARAAQRLPAAQWAQLVSCRVALQGAGASDGWLVSWARAAEDDGELLARAIPAGNQVDTTLQAPELKELLLQAFRAGARGAAPLLAQRIRDRAGVVTPVEAAALALLQGDAMEARQLASRVLKDEPSNPEARRILVGALLRLGYSLAAARVAEGHPRLEARVQVAADRLEAARKTLEAAHDVDALADLAWLYVGLQDWPRAARAATAVLESQPAQPTAWLVAASVALGTGKGQSAETLIQDLRRSPGWAGRQAVYLDGVLAEDVLGDPLRARRDYDELQRTQRSGEDDPVSWRRRFVAASGAVEAAEGRTP